LFLAEEGQMSASQQDRYRPETRLVHAGTLRSQYGETSEALFLTQGYVYENSAQAERRFKNEEPGFQYSRFANPTIAMFEERMAPRPRARPRPAWRR
jgi:O-succinylhomoserine sulfhydrylase